MCVLVISGLCVCAGDFRVVCVLMHSGLCVSLDAALVLGVNDIVLCVASIIIYIISDCSMHLLD